MSRKRWQDLVVLLAIVGAAEIGGLLDWTVRPTLQAQAVNLVVNGGFEAPVIPNGGYQVFSSIPGWAVVSGRPQFELQRRVAGSPYEGEQHCELDAYFPSTIFQDIPTMPGATYELSFAFSARPRRSAADNVLRVSWGGAVVTTLTADGTALPDTSWAVHRFQVTGGAGPTTRLIFEDLGAPNSYGTYIDDVRVTGSSVMNLLVNGSFEDGPPIPSGSSHTTVGAGSTAITGWAVTGANVDYFGPSWTLAHGGRGIDLDGAFATGGIQQTVATTPGQAYVVSFALAGNVDGAPQVKHLRFSVDGLVRDLSFDTLGRTRAAPGWERHSYAFIASGPAVTVSFSSLSPAGSSFGAMIDDVSLVAEPTEAQPPGALTAVSVAGNLVTLRWTAPTLGPEPTGYVIEGGPLPGQVAASIETGSPFPVFTFLAPTGSYYVRVHTRAGASRSSASNEIRIHVNVPVPPSAPEQLLGMVNGSALALAWKNTYLGGPPSNLVLDVSGAFNGSFTLGMAETFAFPAVSAGTYTLAVRATNTGGSSPPSNAVTLTFPGACSGAPATPADFLAYKIGSTIFVLWDPPATGPAPTGYVLQVTGAFTGAIPTTARTLSGTVGAGTYSLSVRATNPCGGSAFTPPQAVTIP